MCAKVFEEETIILRSINNDIKITFPKISKCNHIYIFDNNNDNNTYIIIIQKYIIRIINNNNNNDTDILGYYELNNNISVNDSSLIYNIEFTQKYTSCRKYLEFVNNYDEKNISVIAEYRDLEEYSTSSCSDYEEYSDEPEEISQ